MNDQHPDIEIYVKSRCVAELEAWLKTLGSLETLSHKGLIHQYLLELQGAEIPVMIHEKVSGKAWTSVWFDSAKTPWAKDLDCALQASTELDTQIRCIAGGWENGDDPDEWWKVENGGQEQIQWRT